MGKGNKAEMLIAICAVISSIAAVYIAWDQARVMRSQEKADVWPMIQPTHQTDTAASNTYTFHIQNAGVGPALIEDYIIRIPGQGDTKSFREMVAYFMPNDYIGVASFADATLSGRVLRQGSELEPVRAQFDPGLEIGRKMQSRIDDFLSGEAVPAEVFICYCSILEDCWVMTTLAGNTRPLEVNSCNNLTDVADRLFPQTTPTTMPKELEE